MEYVTWLASILVGGRHIGIWALGLLAYNLLYQVGLRSLPLVTGLTIALQTAVFARWLPVPWRSPREVCLSARHIVPHRQWRRLLLAQVEHIDDWHLYNNMVSFLWKAILLESEMGSTKFAYVLALLLVLTGAIHVVLAFFLSWSSGNSRYINQCSIGFSGVIFALKVLKNVEWFKQAHPFPAWFAWYELLETMILAPQSSFMGHLSGLLAGAAYVYLFHCKPPSFAPVSALISAAFIRALPSSLDAMIQSPCLSADSALNRGDWKLLFMSPLHSHNDLHAAYAFLTMMFLGYRYELSMGSVRFALRVLSMTATTGLLYCWLARKLAEFDFPRFDGVYSYEMQHKCFTGATAAILAIKVSLAVDDWVPAETNGYSLLRRIPLGHYSVLWFAVPCPPVLGGWLEGVLLDTCFPFLWTVGHMAGIAVGIIYAVLVVVLKKFA